MAASFIQISEARTVKTATADVRNLRIDKIPEFSSSIVSAR